MSDIPPGLPRTGPPAIVPPILAEATVRGALRCEMGMAALAGIASAEAVALLKGFLRTSIANRSIIVVATVVIAGLLTAGAGALRVVVDPAQAPRRRSRRKPIPLPQEAASPASPTPRADQDPLIIQAQVVDAEGKPLPGVDVLVAVWYTQSPETTRQAFEPAVTDRDGRIRVEIVRERHGERASSAMVWAYRPGRALTESPTFSAGSKTPPPALRLVLAESARRTITVIGSDDMPISGLGVTPLTMRRIDRAASSACPNPGPTVSPRPPMAFAQATIPDLSAGLQPLTVRISGPGITPRPSALGCAGQRDAEAGSAGATGRHRPRRIGPADRGGPAGNPGPGGRQLAAWGRFPRGNRRSTPTATISLDPPLQSGSPRAPSRLRRRC